MFLIAGTRNALGLRTDIHAMGSTHRGVLASCKEWRWSSRFLEDTRTSLKVAGKYLEGQTGAWVSLRNTG